MPVRAVLFDLDETLTLHERPFEEAYLETCIPASLKYETEASRLVVAQLEASKRACAALASYEFLRKIGIGGRDILWGEAGGNSPELRLVATEIPGFRLTVWTEALRTHGIADRTLAEEMAGSFPHAMSSRIRAYGDTLPLITTLAGRVKLGLVTNGLPGAQALKLRLSGIAGRFEAVAVSGAVGAGKPAPELFQWALRQLDVDAGDAIVIGDRLERDVEGARRAGIRSVWLNRYGAAAPPGAPTPDYVVTGLHEVMGIIGRI